MMYLMPWLARSLGLSQEVAGVLDGRYDRYDRRRRRLGQVLGRCGRNVQRDRQVLAERAASAWNLSPYRSTGRSGGPIRPSGLPRVLWDRFPKFVIDSCDLASVQFLFGPARAKELGALPRACARRCSPVAFVCIGLETDFARSAGPREPSERFDFPDSPGASHRRDACVIALLLFSWLAG